MRARDWKKKIPDSSSPCKVAIKKQWIVCKKSELWHKWYVSSLTFGMKILKIVGNEQNQTRYGPPVCLLYPDTATLPAWCWPKIFEQKTYNFNLDFDILCVKLILKTYFSTIFKSYKNSRCFAYADLGGQSDPQTVALAAIKRQTLSGTKNRQKGVFYAVYEYVFLYTLTNIY